MFVTRLYLRPVRASRSVLFLLEEACRFYASTVGLPAKLQASAPSPQSLDEAVESLIAAMARYAAQMEAQDAAQKQQLTALRQTLRSYEKRLFFAEQQIRQLEDHIQAIMRG